MLLTLIAAAAAETATTLPAGSSVVYSGVTVNTYKKLQFLGPEDGSVRTLDRAVRPRLDAYYARGLSDRLQLSGYLPVVYSTVLGADDDTHGPCPDVQPWPDFCTPLLTVGSAGVQARYRLLNGPVVLTPALSVSSDIWNARYRGRYTGIGDASVDILPGLFLQGGGKVGEIGLTAVAYGAYAWRIGRTLTLDSGLSFSVPADDVRGGAEVHIRPPGPVTVELGVAGLQRLWGLDWDSAYLAQAFPTEDRWTSLYYSCLSVKGKLSLSLGESMGVHLSGERVVRVRNGPPDTTEVGLGVHRYFSPR